MNADHIRFRRADVSDAAALTACVDAAYAPYADHIPDLPPVSEGCAEEIADNQVWVALLGDAIVGGLFLVSSKGRMKLANVAVHPDHGGKGIGRELIALAEKEAASQGFDEIHLNTHSAMTGNIRLYARLGWQEVSRQGNTVSMRKALNRHRT